MTGIEHDGAASLRIEWRDSSNGRVRGVCVRRPTAVAGWYVVRTCPCHKGEPITRPFDSREQAERVLEFLDLDARSRHARRYG